MKSRDDSQLHGRDTAVSSNCDPLDADAAGNTYAPCGYIANSMFNGMSVAPTALLRAYKTGNCVHKGALLTESPGSLNTRAHTSTTDTISLSTAAGAPITLNADSIAWNSDANEKFMNPASWTGTVQPPNWNHTAMDFPSVAQYPELNQVGAVVWALFYACRPL